MNSISPHSEECRLSWFLRVIVATAGMLALVAGTLVAAATPPAPSADEQAIWKLERDYWQFVQANDLKAYANLWHANFLGWPGVSAAPVRKDHITDWITAQTSQGLVLKTAELKPASIQVTGDVAMAAYWITYKWTDKAGQGTTGTSRITHAWVRSGNTWCIIGGMSMPEPEAPKP